MDVAARQPISRTSGRGMSPLPSGTHSLSPQRSWNTSVHFFLSAFKTHPPVQHRAQFPAPTQLHTALPVYVLTLRSKSDEWGKRRANGLAAHHSATDSPASSPLPSPSRRFWLKRHHLLGVNARTPVVKWRQSSQPLRRSIPRRPCTSPPRCTSVACGGQLRNEVGKPPARRDYDREISGLK